MFWRRKSKLERIKEQIIMAIQAAFDDLKADMTAKFAAAGTKLDAIAALVQAGANPADILAGIADVKAGFDAQEAALEAKEDAINPPPAPGA